MTIPVVPRIGLLVLASTAFYGYVGQMVPQNEVQPPAAIVIRTDLTTDEMVEIGRDITETKGLCRTCHTIGQTGALRFPDLAGIATRAATRVPGLNDVEYFAQSMYEPDVFVVPGFNPGMPTINRPPIGLTDQEILCVMAYLQSLGGTPTVTLQTSHAYYKAPAAPGGPPAPGEAPPAGAPADQKPEPGEQLPLTAPPAEKAAPVPAAPAAPGVQPAPAAPARGRGTP
jgi:Cytochrome c